MSFLQPLICLTPPRQEELDQVWLHPLDFWFDSAQVVGARSGLTPSPGTYGLALPHVEGARSGPTPTPGLLVLQQGVLEWLSSTLGYAQVHVLQQGANFSPFSWILNKQMSLVKSFSWLSQEAVMKAVKVCFDKSSWYWVLLSGLPETRQGEPCKQGVAVLVYQAACILS